MSDYQRLSDAVTAGMQNTTEQHKIKVDKINSYFDGVESGVRRFAVWEDGEQYVGSCGTTLRQAYQTICDERKAALEKL